MVELFLDKYGINDIKDAKNIREKIKRYYSLIFHFTGEKRFLEIMEAYFEKRPKKFEFILNEEEKKKYRLVNKKSERKIKSKEIIDIVKKSNYSYKQDIIKFIKENNQFNYKYIKRFIEFDVKFPIQRLKRLIKCKPPTASLFWHFLVYGKEEGKLQYEKYKKFHSEKNKGKSKKYNQNRAVTLENMVMKYGEKYGKKFFEDYREKQKIRGKSLEYFKEKYGEEDGLKKYQEINKRKAVTLENLIRKYGDKEGLKRYKKYKNKALKNINFYSKKACKFIEELMEFNKIEDYMYKENEKFIYDENLFFYDCYVPSKNLIIEFNGDYWHLNPKKYDKNEKVLEMTYNQIKEKDEKKKEIALKNGFNYIVVWESYYDAFGVKNIDINKKGFQEYNI